MKWNKLSEKLPKINKPVFILRRNLKNPTKAKLKVFCKKDDSIDFVPKLKEGDIFWFIYCFEKKRTNWMDVDLYPYWIEIDDIEEIIISDNNDWNDSNKINNRAEILDIRKE